MAASPENADGRRASLSENMRQALADVTLAAVLYITVLRLAEVFNGARHDVNVRKVVSFTLVLALFSFILKSTKRSQANVLINAVYFQLGSMFSRQFM